MAEYEPKAAITKISATSRASVKLRDNYYTVEYSEERVIPDLDGVNIELERQALWDAVNTEVDDQAEALYNILNQK